MVFFPHTTAGREGTGFTRFHHHSRPASACNRAVDDNVGPLSCLLAFTVMKTGCNAGALLPEPGNETS